MGQRLIINNYTPYSEQEITNNIYYHWSAYTDASIYEVEELRNKIEEYYEEYYDHSKNKLDFFNLACLNAISGISPSNKESVKYIEKITKKTYNSDHVNRNNGMIAFTPKEINDYLDWAEGIVYIYWQFNEDGTPDFDNSLFNIPDLVWSTTETELKEHMNKEKIEAMKSNPKNVQLTNIPIIKANKDFIDQIPEIWYDKDLELFFETIE